MNDMSEQELKAEIQRLREEVKSSQLAWLLTINQMAERIATAEAANELDRRALHAVVRSIDEEITGRMWLIEGRGCYEWDDDKYRQEFGWAVHALQEKLEPLRKIAGDLTNCPKTEEGVNSVRRLEAENVALRQQVAAYEQPVSDEELLPIIYTLPEYIQQHLLNVRWKDGIDIEEPNRNVKLLVDSLIRSRKQFQPIVEPEN